MRQWLIFKIGCIYKIPQGWGGPAYLANSLVVLNVSNIVANKNRKADPKEMSAEMRQLKSENGERWFMPSEFLSNQQINIYFSRKAQKTRPATDTDTDSHDSALLEQTMSKLNNSILKKNNSTGIEDLTWV